MSASLDAPDADVVEVSLLGPGLGEALVLHAGGGDWLLVDSCFDDDGQPAALAYFGAIGVAPSQVRCVVATHWDDDHIGGLAQTLDACTDAAFCCSMALRTGEFLLLTETRGATSLMTRSGYSEFTAIVEILKGRKLAKQRFPTPTFAIEGRPLWRREARELFPAARLTALSPSDAGVALAQRALAQLIPTSGEPKRRVRAPSPNRASVVLDFWVGATRVLLGADLERTTDPATGWLPILDGMHRPDTTSSGVKVPHHGSEDADEPRVWDELLDQQPIAFLTPFVQGDIELPREGDRKRLLGRTENLFITSAQPRRRRRHGAAVERTLREGGVVVRDADQPMGHVRLRRRGGDNAWAVDLFGPAARVAA